MRHSFINIIALVLLGMLFGWLFYPKNAGVSQETIPSERAQDGSGGGIQFEMEKLPLYGE